MILIFDFKYIQVMKKILFLLIALSVFGCNTDDNNTVPRDIEIQDFVWKGLNLYYLWQEDVPNLADNRFDSQNQLNSFLKGYSDPTDLFNSLLYQRGTIDRFSVIYSDYIVLEQTLTGTSKNNGVDYGLFRKTSGSDEVIGWVRYILPDSDASNKTIQRGDLFYAVNGTPLTASNYQSLLSNENYTLNLADYDEGNYTPNGQNVSLTKGVYEENPVYYKNVYDIESHKIGYLVYNGFYGGYDVGMNNAFAYFQSEGVTDLVLDLRYNSGGSVASATHLASMITGQFTGQIFAKQQWNAKVTKSFEDAGREEELINRFTNKLANGSNINHLNLNRVYILTTSSTASASELIINGLDPHIEVVQIGGKTTGKNVGSITLYDSPNYGRNNRNTRHKYAMQPLTLKIANSVGFGDYQQGLSPDSQNILSENFGNIRALGDTSELFLATAISRITGLPLPPSTSRLAQQIDNTLPLSDSKKMIPLRTEMYLDEVPEGIIDIIRN